jgi:hypothetical protein
MRSAVPARRVWLLAGGLALTLLACEQAGAENGSVGQLRAAIVYGEDGRAELWEAPNESLRAVANALDVAILESAHVGSCIR